VAALSWMGLVCSDVSRGLRELSKELKEKTNQENVNQEESGEK
jgi:hypothetical protein